MDFGQENRGRCKWLSWQTVHICITLVYLMFLVICLAFYSLKSEIRFAWTLADWQQLAAHRQKEGNRTPELNTAVPFTTDELSYLRSGKGEIKLVNPRDPRYLASIRSQIAKYSPAKPTKVKRFNEGHHQLLVEKRLNGRRNGFFVECGANNGEYLSNTMYLERYLNWAGLLVEANPRLSQELLTRNRQAFVYPGCLSPGDRPATLRFKSAGCCGGLVDNLSNSLKDLIDTYGFDRGETIDHVQCYPLSDLLAAINVDHVDYLSLDVHGAEMAIVKAIDFRSLRIDLMSIECYETNQTLRRRIIEEYSKLFAATGLYKEVEVGQNDLIVERLNTAASSK